MMLSETESLIEYIQIHSFRLLLFSVIKSKNDLHAYGGLSPQIDYASHLILSKHLFL